MKGGSRLQWQMNNFREAVEDCGLRDVDFEGYAYTYDIGQEENVNRQCRLDRALCNDPWSELFPRAKLYNLNREWSDHSPIILKLNRRGADEREFHKLFRFEQIWIGEGGCEDTVRDACADLSQKWKGVSIGKIVRDINKKRRRLAQLNEGGRTREDVQERKRVVKDIAKLLNQEEVFWRQRSKALWLKEGDRNTKYFHRKAGQRKKRNHIAMLVDREGREQVGVEAITGVEKGYFEELFTSGQPINFEDFLDDVEGRVT
ncbi:uncharacterized protein LOC141651607 [Silene latifolia]|uniref:uncharacterized protein LOC141651607 n=1 Tax=Silene latifolia TaxID=37657 RepID=UPI003D76C9DD